MEWIYLAVVLLQSPLLMEEEISWQEGTRGNSLHALLPTKVIHQNRSHTLRKIMEIRVTVKYLEKCKIDYSNSQTHLGLWFYPAQDRWTPTVDVVSLKMYNSKKKKKYTSNCSCLSFHSLLIRTNQYSLGIEYEVINPTMLFFFSLSLQFPTNGGH